MAIVINNFDENVETGDAFTPDVTGDDNLLIHGGNALDSGSIATMGQQDLASTNMTQTSIHDLETPIGGNTIVGASGYILDASIPSGSSTFTQATTGTFPDMTHNLCTISGADQTTPFKETSIVTYSLATPGALTYNVGTNGGLAILHVTTNVNNITAPTGTGTWTQQGTNKSLSTLSQYHIYTRLITGSETGTTVTPTMDGDGTGRGFARIEVWNAAAAAGGGLSIPVAMNNYRRFR
jgi:hypothetical protein